MRSNLSHLLIFFLRNLDLPHFLGNPAITDAIPNKLFGFLINEGEVNVLTRNIKVLGKLFTRECINLKRVLMNFFL